MQRRKFSGEFKIEAVRLVRDGGVSVAQASRDIDVHENVLRKWVKDFGSDPKQAFPGHGQQKPDQVEIDRLRRRGHEAQGGARHSKKGRSLLREGVDMKFGFVAKHRSIWPLAWLCEALGVSRLKSRERPPRQKLLRLARSSLSKPIFRARLAPVAEPLGPSPERIRGVLERRKP